MKVAPHAVPVLRLIYLARLKDPVGDEVRLTDMLKPLSDGG